MRTLACALVVAACAAAVVRAAQAPPLVIQADRVVAGVPLLVLRTTLEARLGPPDSARRQSDYECRLTWRRLGLVAGLLDLSREAPCRDGVFRAATVTSRAWRTARGLHVGSPMAQVRRLYPAARLHGGFAPQNGWWLVTRRSCAEVGSVRYPGLLARMRAGRVSALVVGVAACE